MQFEVKTHLSSPRWTTIDNGEVKNEHILVKNFHMTNYFQCSNLYNFAYCTNSL